MALQLDKELDSGYVANYWKILKMETSFAIDGPFTSINLGLYKDSEARNSNKDPILTIYLMYNKSIETRALAYNEIKTPILNTIIDTPAVYDENGNIVEPEKSHTIDTNIFSKATDV